MIRQLFLMVILLTAMLTTVKAQVDQRSALFCEFKPRTVLFFESTFNQCGPEVYSTLDKKIKVG